MFSSPSTLSYLPRHGHYTAIGYLQARTALRMNDLEEYNFKLECKNEDETASITNPSKRHCKKGILNNHSNITKLKIDSNPFAKGFRDSSRLTDLERESVETLLREHAFRHSPFVL
ncbi:hypothetical protein CEXT_194351 [Caerostris extrusa]|uniref:T-box domain-containing protein n=1 Tax=Caerostris extrusa TaxID=172846 RepID=A0AAV4ML31_CAEEX|nr:hypothetical protein CEXT_194351 [Caerostris extrusa]